MNIPPASARFMARCPCWALLILMSCFALPARAETLMRWKFVPHDVSNFTFSTSMQQDTTLEDTKLKTIAEQVLETTWTIGDVDADGTANMTQTIKRLRMDVKTWQNDVLGQAIKLDSASKEQPTGLNAVLAPMIMGLVNKPISLRVTSLGKIIEFKLSDELLEAQSKSPNGAKMGGIFTPEGLKQMLSQSILTFPEKPLAKGDSWNTALDVDQRDVGKQSVASTYTYQGADTIGGKKLDVIDSKQETKFQPAKDATGSIELKDQKSSGVIHFDNARGELIDSESSTTMKMKMTMMGRTLDQDITIKVAMKRKTADAR